MERYPRSGKWYYSTPDSWIRLDEPPKDELVGVEDNWPLWIWHDCGSYEGYKLVCIESGRYSNYWAYKTGGNFGISWSPDPQSEDWTWTHFYVIEEPDDYGRVVLCNWHKSPYDPENCPRYDSDWFGTGYIFVPPSCAGWERENCCHNLECTLSYEQGITNTQSTSTSVTVGGEFGLSSTVGKALYLEEYF